MEAQRKAPQVKRRMGSNETIVISVASSIPTFYHSLQSKECSGKMSLRDHDSKSGNAVLGSPRILTDASPRPRR